MNDLNNILEKNRAWAEAQDPELLKQMAAGQSPEVLWIGCSDSRVPAAQVCGLKPGEIFVHRNIANMVLHTDISSLSVIEFAVGVLKVQRVIVCGHTSCGGVAGALDNAKIGLIDNWLRHIQDVREANKSALDAVSDEAAKVDLLVELNVRAQVANTKRNRVVEAAVAERGLTVHGVVFDLATGRLKEVV